MQVRVLSLFEDEYPSVEVEVAHVKKGKVAKAELVKKEKPSKLDYKDDGLPIATFKAEKNYYNISEVAHLYAVRTSHIRFWTKSFNIPVRTNGKGDRMYTPENILLLRTIYDLVKIKGFTITGAKAKLKELKTNTFESFDLKKALLHLRNQLVQIKNEL